MTDELDKALARLQERRGKSEKLRTSMAYGMDQNPDNAARARAVAERLGTSQDYALGDLEHLGRAQRAGTFDFDGFIRDYPKMAGWLENPDNAAIAHDDLDTLAGIETVAGRAQRAEANRVEKANIQKGLSGGRGFLASRIAEAGESVASLVGLPGDIENTLEGFVANVFGVKVPPGGTASWGTGLLGTGGTGSLKTLSLFADLAKQKLKPFQRETQDLLIKDPVTGRDVWNMDSVKPWTFAGFENATKLAAGEAVPMAAMIGLEAATGGAATPVAVAKYGPKAAKLLKYWRLATRPSALATVARTVQGQREEGIQHLMRKGMSRGEAEVKAAPGALLAGVFSFAAGAPLEAKYLQGLLGKIETAPGGRTLVQRIGGKVMGLAAGATKEGAQEVANGIGEDLAAWMTYHPDLTFKQSASNAIQNFYGGAVLGGASSSLAEGFKSDQKAMADLADIAGKSKLLARDPKAFIDAATGALKDTPHEHVFVDAGQFQILFQSKGMDPAEVARLAGAMNYEEAVAAGTDLVIPMADYLTHLAKDHHKDLAPDLRMKAGDPSQREMDAMQAAGDQDIKAKGQAKPEEADEQARIDEAVASLDMIPRFQIQDEVKAQLEAVGYEAGTAETYARAHAAVMFNLAERAGIDPMEMHQRYGLTVSRPLLEERPDMPVMDIVLSRLEEQKRAGEETDFEMFGQEVQAPDRRPVAPGRLRAQINEEASASLSDREGTTQRYQADERTKGGVIVNGDVMAEIASPTVAANPVQGHGLIAEGGAPSQLANDYFENRMAEPTKSLDEAVLVLVGNAAAGKSSFAADNSGHYHTVLDSNQAQAQGLIENINQALRSGRKVDVLLVHVPIEEAVRRNVARQAEQGRAVSLKDQADLEAGTIGSFIQAFDVFSQDPDVSFSAVENTDAGLDAGGKVGQDAADFAQQIREGNAPTSLLNRAAQAYTDLIGGPNAPSPEAREVFERGTEAPAGAGIPGGPDLGRRGGLAEVQPGAEGTAPEGLIVLAQGSKPLIFGSKEWNEYYKLGKGAKDKGDLARRARAGLKKILTTTGQREDLARREAELRAEYAERLKEKADFEAWDREVKAIIAGDVYSEDDRRGFIQFGADRKFQIGLLRDANLSTFIHEAGHFYIEIMHDLAATEGVSDELKADLATLRKHAGADPEGGKLTEEQHEILARSHEAYVMEGKSPSEELRPVFARMASWMTFIYRMIERLGVRLNKDVRGVFDRMYASELEIAAVKSQSAGPMFATAAEMGVTQAEFDLYAKTQKEEILKGTEALQQKLMDEMNRERTKLWEEELEKTIEEVRPEIETDPTYVAHRSLVKGETEDGTKIKINRESIVDFFGEPAANEMPKKTTTKRGGVDVHTASELLGFESPERMMEALRNLEPAEQKIKRVAEDRMKAIHGDMMLDGSISDAAVDALHNGAREDVLAMELRALKRKAAQLRPGMVFERQKAREAAADRRALTEAVEGERRFAEAEDDFTRRAYLESIPPQSVFRDSAAQLLQKMRVRDINPNRYLQAQRKHGRESFKLNGVGEWKAAADAKQKELMNHHLYLEAVKAKAQVEAIAKYGRKFDKKKVRAKIAKAHGGFLDQIDGILERFSFRDVSLRKLDESFQTLASFALEQSNAGEEVAIEGWMFKEEQRNFKELTLPELEAVGDALKNIEKIARRQVEMLAAGRRLEYETAVEELGASAVENRVRNRPLPVDPLTIGMVEKAQDKVAKIDAMLIKMEQLVDWLDGGDINGPWRKYLWDPIAEAQTFEYDLTKEFTDKVRKAMDAMPKDQRMKLLDTYDIPGIGVITKHRLLSMALNTGNESNLTKMLKGQAWADRPEVLSNALSKLNRSDWEFVQTVWDTLEGLWPHIAALEERMTGLVPPRVEPRPFEVQLNDGGPAMVLRGGYYPMVYDPAKSSVGAKQEAGDVSQLMDAGYVKATTPKGHAKERIEKFSAPVLLDFEQVLTRHLAGTIKDISHREAVLHANRLITNQNIRGVLQETLGPAYEAQFLPWLRNIVNDRNGSAAQGLGDFSQIMMTMRGNMVASALGFKAASVIVQASDWVRATDRVKTKHLTPAILEFMRHPAQVIKEVRDLSGQMRHRPQNLDRDIRGVLKRGAGREGALKGLQRFAFMGISMADTITSTTTWLGAYRQAMAQGSDKSTAIREADRTVGLVLQAGNPKDITAAQRGDNLAKFLTTFMGDATPAYSILRDAMVQSKEAKNIPKQASRIFWGIMMPMVLGSLIKGRGPGDDEEPAAWAIKTALLSVPNTIPVLRDVAAAVDSGRDYRFTPAAAALEKGSRLLGKTADIATGEDVDWTNYSETAFDSFGTFFGLPGTAQILTTSRYLRKVSSGEISEPESEAQFAAEAVLGRNPKKR